MNSGLRFHPEALCFFIYSFIYFHSNVENTGRNIEIRFMNKETYF